MRVLPILAPCA